MWEHPTGSSECQERAGRWQSVKQQLARERRQVAGLGKSHSGKQWFLCPERAEDLGFGLFVFRD